MQVIFSFQFKIAAKVKTAHLFVVCQLLCRAMLKDLALYKQVCTVTNRQRFVYIVVGDKDTDISVFKTGHDCLDIFHSNRVNACKGFVKKNKFRING